MKSHALASHAAATRPKAHRQRSEMVRFVLDRFLLLPLGAAIALLWANLAGESYFRVAHALAFPVNEIGMALFLALIAQEALEAVMPGGALHAFRRWGTAAIAAGGGIAGAAVTYAAYVSLAHEQVLMQAWPIACAIDVGAAYYVSRMIFRGRVAVSFLLVVAIVTDGVALVVLAGWTPFSPGHVGSALLLGTAVALAAVMRRQGVRALWPYFAVCGAISWWALYSAGIHPALALVPLVPFIPHAPRNGNLFADVPDDSPVHHAEHEWHEVVQVVLFLFGLVNAGVPVSGYDTGTWAVVVAALVGRPIGILAAVALALAAGFHLPRNLGWRQLIVIAMTTTSGFTLALFFAGGLLPVGAVLQQIKFGALATAVGALVAVAAARGLGTGRFAR
jgi:Na+:H+ antiporter, NhaA family